MARFTQITTYLHYNMFWLSIRRKALIKNAKSNCCKKSDIFQIFKKRFSVQRLEFEVNYMVTAGFFATAPSFEAWETHRYLKNRLGIVRARGGGLLDHP